MKEITLELKKFGGIKNATIELNRVNVFIGEQATGKSLIAKVLFFCNHFFNYYKEMIMQHRSIEDFDEILKIHFKSFFAIDSLEPNFNIKYVDNNSSLTLRIKREGNSNITIKYNKEWRDKFGLYKAKISIGSNNLNINCDNILEDIPVKSQIFIPAARAIISAIQNYPWHFKDVPFDIFIKDFGRYYEMLKNQYFGDKNLFKDEIKTINEIIKGTHTSDGVMDYLEQNNRKTPLQYTSSGQQEAISLVEVLELSDKYLLDKNKNIVLYIEEFEAHLYPKAQQIITEMVTRIFKKFSENMQVVITTHSPYILTSLNNLMYAGIVEEKIQNDSKKKKELYSIVDKQNIINAEYVNAFFMQQTKSGSIIKSIIDEDTKLINANEIDEVSFELADKFDKLTELEVDGN